MIFKWSAAPEQTLPRILDPTADGRIRGSVVNVPPGLGGIKWTTVQSARTVVIKSY